MPKTTSRSEPRRLILLITAALLAHGPASGDTIERVYPLRPFEQASAGARPLFEIGYETVGEDSHPQGHRFRINLRPLRLSDTFYEFDQRVDRRGWLLGEPYRVLYRPRVPLEDGVYRWSVHSWNGTTWSAGNREQELRVDSVPPADVEGLRVELARDGLTLDWEPVTLDRDGRPEFVYRYHVYRYESAATPLVAVPYQIGTTEQPPFVDRTPLADAARVLYYRVTAEDESGNEPGRRD